MSHALIWSEISTTDLQSEVNKEIPYAGMGTATANSWSKKIYKLKWLNTSVNDIKIWLDNSFADIYTSTEFPIIKASDAISITEDLGFEFRVTTLDTFNIDQLPNANVATNLNLSSESLGGTQRLLAPQYIDGYKISAGNNILVKSQTTKSENGLYKILAQKTGTGSSGFSYQLSEDIYTAGKFVGVGASEFYSYLVGYSPFQFVGSGTTSVIWVSTKNTYQLNDVKAATTENLQSSGAGLSSQTNYIDNAELALNDRLLVKDQTNKAQNGIYYLSSLYASNKNTVVDTRVSADPKDNFWDTAVYNITKQIPVSVQVMTGTTYGGKYYRHYLTSDFVAMTILEEGGGSGGVIIPDSTPGVATTLASDWVDATHYYGTFAADWYYEVPSAGALGFTFDFVSNAGTFTSAPTNLVSGLGVTTLTVANEKVLVKHPTDAYSGVYNIFSVGLGNTSVWKRHTSFDTAAEIIPTIVSTKNSLSSIGSSYFYMNKETTYNPNFILNFDGISIDPRFTNYYYEPVANTTISEITNFDSVNSSKFANSGIAISQRVLVAGQATTQSQNGLYIVGSSALGSTKALSFYSQYSIVNGSIANSAGTGGTFFLYSSQDNVSAGTADVEFVNISSASTETANTSTSVDKFTSVYISPDDFSVGVNTSDKVLVNTSNKKVNGFYTATLSSPQKAVFNYSDSLVTWSADILRNVTSTNTDIFTVSPNFKDQISGILYARNTSAYGSTSFANSIFGNIYVPEINLPSKENLNSFFATDNLSSAFLQELDFSWYVQDYQNYKVKAVYNSTTIAGLPISSGTAISTKISNNTLITNNDEVLFYIGTGNSCASSYNGIYRARLTGTGGSVYFIKHTDFDLTTEFLAGTNRKITSSPYERPTKVLVNSGYMVGGSAFGSSVIYMQGMLGYANNISALGSTAITPNDDNQYDLGQEYFVSGSDIRLSIDYNNLFNFPALAPIQHYIAGDLTNKDTVDGDMLTVNRGRQLYTILTDPSVIYFYEIGDRVIYQDPNEDVWNNGLPNHVNGIYQIVHINTSTWTYYLRRVKQRVAKGHIDYPKELEITPGDSIFDASIHLSKAGTSDTYYWNQNNYPSLDVFVLDAQGNKTEFKEGVDFDIFPQFGYIAPYSGFASSSTDTLHVYLYSDFNTPRYNEQSKSLYNRYFTVEQVLDQKYFINGGVAITQNIYTADNKYFQISNVAGLGTTTEAKNNTDRNHWYKTYNASKSYKLDIDRIINVSNANEYFYTARQSTDGFYKKVGTAFTATYLESNIFMPGTGETLGLFTGTIYLEKAITSGSGFTIDKWFDSLNLQANQNVLVLSNNEVGLATTLQSSYYNDNNVLIQHNKAGKKDQKIYKFANLGYTPVTLSYDTSFTNPLSPLNVIYGSNKYFLHYDPNNTSRADGNKSWYDYSGVTVYSCNVATGSSIVDFSDFGGTINSYSPAISDLILVKNQTNKKQNGIYSVYSNPVYKLSRSGDFASSSDIRALGKVVYGNTTYELILPSTAPYSIGSTSGNTAINWIKSGYGQTIDVKVATFVNYSGVALTTAFPDAIDGTTLAADDKILLISQSTSNEKYVGRFTQNIAPIYTRVAENLTVSGFAITACSVEDLNTLKEYILYFNPSNRTLGTHEIDWFEANKISDYTSASRIIDSNVSLVSSFSDSSITLGQSFLLLSQTDNKQNGLYKADSNISYYLSRHENLDESSEVSINKKCFVTSGSASTGYYALVYDETATPSIGSSSLYWARVSRSNKLADCNCATTSSNTDINLSSPPSSIDGITLEKGYRILVKNQDTNKHQNGIYVVTGSGAEYAWARAEDLNSDTELVPQLSVYVVNGTTNEDTIWRIKLGTPRTITYSQLTEYVIGTDSIQWISVDKDGLFNSNPSTWQILGSDSANAFYLGSAKIDRYSTASSNRFAIAVKIPTSESLASNDIIENGKVRNIKFKVEYKTIED